MKSCQKEGIADLYGTRIRLDFYLIIWIIHYAFCQPLKSSGPDYANHLLQIAVLITMIYGTTQDELFDDEAYIAAMLLYLLACYDIFLPVFAFSQAWIADFIMNP